MVEYETTLLPNRHLAALDAGSTTPKDWLRRTGRSIGYPAWGLLYYALLCRLDPKKGTLVETLKLPSGGDTSYAGLVWHKGLLWISYYSSHQGKTSIYLAKVRFDDGKKKSK